MILDTHRFVENLVAAGYEKKQAEVFVQELNENQKELATKEDLKLLQSELKQDISSLKIDISEVRSELKQDMSNLKYDIINWMFGFFISTIAINITAIGILIRFLLK